MKMTAVEQKKSVQRVTIIALAANFLVALFKLLAGYYGNSRAVVADAIHSFSDCISDIGLLIGLYFWTKPNDENHHYGHGRIEQIFTFFFGLALVSIALGIGYDALNSLHTSKIFKPSWIAFIAAIVSILGKEVLYRYTIKVGRQVRSSAVIANAWHHRSDALSSLPAALSVGVALFFSSWRFIDLIGAVVVAFFILQAALKITLPSIACLIDTAPPKQLCKDILDIASAIPGVRSAHALRCRYIGTDIALDLHVEVDEILTVRQGHDIAECIEHELIEKFDEIVDVVVHIEPYTVDLSQFKSRWCPYRQKNTKQCLYAFRNKCDSKEDKNQGEP